MRIEVDIQKKLGEFQMNLQFTSSSSRIGILGASGCGKSMTLKSIAGIETPDAGRICIGERVLYDSGQKINQKPQKRNIGYLFQNYALFPTMTVAQNIAAGLSGNRHENQKRVKEMIEKFQLQGMENHLPEQLSGGQQQRVALARIMAYEPDVILLDEPFSALDVFLKDRLQRELEEMLEGYPGIVILVSHSRDEVYRFSEELLVMDHGKIACYGKTKEIFAHPQEKTAAKLTGCKNFSRIRNVDEYTVVAEDWGVTLHLKHAIPENCTYVGYRAHDFIPIWGEEKENCMGVKIQSVAELPFERQYYLETEQAVEKEKKQRQESEPVCWFVQREQAEELDKKGCPNWLEIKEENLMFLKG